jgi:hypothetical protein
MLTCGLWARQAYQAHVLVCLTSSQPCNEVELASAGNTCTQLTLVLDAGCDSYGGCLAHARHAMLCYMQPFIDGCCTGGDMLAAVSLVAPWLSLLANEWGNSLYIDS